MVVGFQELVIIGQETLYVYSNKTGSMKIRNLSQLLLHLIHFNNNENTDQTGQHKLVPLTNKLRNRF
jgi:hypothetical protein